MSRLKMTYKNAQAPAGQHRTGHLIDATPIELTNTRGGRSVLETSLVVYPFFQDLIDGGKEQMRKLGQFFSFPIIMRSEGKMVHALARTRSQISRNAK